METGKRTTGKAGMIVRMIAGGIMIALGFIITFVLDPIKLWKNMDDALFGGIWFIIALAETLCILAVLGAGVILIISVIKDHKKSKKSENEK